MLFSGIRVAVRGGMGVLSFFLVFSRVVVLPILPAVFWAQQSTSCDVNRDGKVDIADVQLITNMEIGAPGFPCTVNIGGVLGCTEAARQVVIKASLGQGCHFNFLTWKPSASPGIVGYYVYRSAAADGKSANLLNPGKPIARTAYADIGAAAGGSYFYLVKGTDGRNELKPVIHPSVREK